jgi:hypothetical protein
MVWVIVYATLHVKMASFDAQSVERKDHLLIISEHNIKDAIRALLLGQVLIKGVPQEHISIICISLLRGAAVFADPERYLDGNKSEFIDDSLRAALNYLLHDPKNVELGMKRYKALQLGLEVEAENG